jgi:5'-3' exonuclease
MPARPPLAPLRAPAAEPRFAFTTLHRVLPPPMAGTVAPQPVAPPQPPPDAPSPAVHAIDVDAADDVDAATLPAAPAAVHIEFELPDRVDDDEELDEWEDVDDAPALTKAAEEATNLLAAALAQAEEVGRLSPPPETVIIEEAAVPMARSAVYKRSHGFVNGRSLDAWDGGAGGAGAPPPAADAEEQRELEMAIQRSLSDAAVAKKPRMAVQSSVIISLLDDDDAPRPAPPADMPAHRRPPSPLKLWEPSPPVVLDDEDDGGAGAGDDDADLRAAIAASLGQAPPPPPAAPELTVQSQGVTWRLTLAEFAGLAGNLSHHWPPWLPSPLDLEDKPVKVRCAGQAWDVDTPMEESLLGIVVQARRAARGEPAPPQSRKQAPKSSKAASMLPPPPPRTMATPAPVPVPDGPAWEARWENVSSVWRAQAVAPVARVSAASPGARAATAEEEAELSALDAEAAAEAEAAQAAEFARERAALQAERASAARGADTVTPEMYGEVQRMLTSFGIPFIIAPAEAEAQCAWLDANGLVDGVVTDDSDVFLFGARTVYRNLFDAKKYVEVYTADRVQRRLGLDRDRLALLALLLGSDYTPGVQGVGPVNAAEIISAFPTMDALRRFKAWIDAPESDRVADEAAKLAGGRRGARAKVASPDKPAAAEAAEGGDAAVASPAAAAGAATAASLDVGADGTEAEEKYKRAQRGRRKAWSLSESFPSQLVVDAYMRPSVDTSRARFEWGRPNAAELRHLCRDTLGLLQPDLEKVLDRIVTEHDIAETQRTMNSFFMPQQAEQPFAKMRSKRMAKAIGGLTGRAVDPELVLGDLDAAPTAKKPRKPRAPKAAKPKVSKPKKKKALLASSDEEESSGGASDDEYAPKEPRATRAKAAAAGQEAAPAGAAAGAAPEEVIVLDDDDNEDDE